MEALAKLVAHSVFGGLACGFGGAIPAMVPATRRLAGAQAACGGGLLALAVGVALPSALSHVAPQRALGFFTASVILAALGARYLRTSLRTPLAEALCFRTPSGRARDADVERALGALITACALAVHNVLEGFMVRNSGYQQPRVVAATALLLEHLPEGVAIAIPVYVATRRRWAGARIALIVGMLEPIAALAVALCLPSVLSPAIVGGAYACVAGIITFIATAEMIPAAVAGIGGASLSSWMGAGVMTATICEPLMTCEVQREAVR